MEQMREKFSGAEQGRIEESSSARNQRTPPQKTQSFEGGGRKKKTQNWFQKQFSGKMMNGNHDSNHITEEVVGVAAAAYVVNLIAEERIQDQKKTSAGLEPSLIKDKSRMEDMAASILKPGTVSEWPTGESSTKGSENAESKVPATDTTDEKATRRAPSFKKPVTFADHIGSTSGTKPRSSQKPDLLSSQPESAEPKPDHLVIKPGTAPTRPEQPPTIKPVAPEIDFKSKIAARPDTDERKAEAWEKAEMAKIKERYAKLNSTILAWEEKKQKKARNKLDKAEKSESQQKRAQALTKYRNELDYIKQVVDAARAQARVRQRNDELKAKEKANIIRTTGELPKTCLCC